eukprot:m.19967 g.19967  ORF g.19967 m.19967 type:complete len:612 (+) comp3738_c0_seq1:432-2267(+)
MLKERPIVGLLVGLLVVGFAANMYHLRGRYSVRGGNQYARRHGISGSQQAVGDSFDGFVEGEDESTPTPTMAIVHAGEGGKIVRTTLRPRPQTQPPKLPVWLKGITPRAVATTVAAPPPKDDAVIAPIEEEEQGVVEEQGDGQEGKWPRWQTLPEACAPKKVRPTVKIPFEEFAQQKDAGDLQDVYQLEQLPSKYYTRVKFSPEKLTRIPHHLPGGKESEKSEELFDKFLHEAPDSEILYCFPWGIGVDNTIAGPMSKTVEDSEGPISKFTLFFKKFWYARSSDVRAIAQNKAEIIDIPGMVVQLSGWTAFVFNHFSLDSMIRLSMVIDRLKSDDPLWGTAKIMAAMTPVQEKNADGSWKKPKPEDMRKGALWVWQKTGLVDRLIPATGWAYKSIAAYRAEYLVLPDVYPHPTCGGMPAVKDPWFPRGALLPLQRHLGVFDKGVNRNLVIWAGRASGMRSIASDSAAAFETAIKEEIAKTNKACPKLNLEFWNFQHDDPTPNGGDWHDFDLFRRAVMILGPHGQQLWNQAFAPPGTTVIEFSSLTGTVEGSRKADDCRHCGWAMANAAGHNYWLEEPDGFSFFHGNLKPSLPRVMSIVASGLKNMTKKCKA